MFRKPAFLLVSLCEIWFAIFALFEPADAQYFAAMVAKLILPQALYISMIFWATLFIALYYLNRFTALIAPVSVVLALCWFMMLLGLFESQYLTISIPLIIFMIFIRILMAMMVEAERHYGK